MRGGRICVTTKDGWLEGSPVGGNDLGGSAVYWINIEAVGGNDLVVTTVLVGADVRAVGRSDVVVRGSDVVDEVARSMSIGGAGGNGTLKTGFGGFFKASKCL
uniref:Uncharacterized protein n=1 Tax=Romanomermis culicivorax TaxID=13658 RepID=A0A915KGZ5_ROMCU